MVQPSNEGHTAAGIVGAGNVRIQFSSRDWSATPLGPAEAWPPALRMAVDLMLDSPQPVYIGWGPELISLYNDGYIPFVNGRHPDALGLPYREVWPHLWDEFRPVADAVMAGEFRAFVDHPVPLAGRPDRPMSWFTFSWTPLRLETGEIGGFYCTAIETTDRVLAERSLQHTYRALFDSIDEAFCVIKMVFDEHGVAVDYLVLETNPAFVTHTGLVDAVGKYMRDLAPEHETFWYRTYGRIALSGRSERFEHRAEALGRWYSVHAFRVGDPADHRVAVLFEDISVRKAAEREQKENEARQTFLLAMADALRVEADDQVLGRLGTRMLAERLGVERCWICRVPGHDSPLRVGPEYHAEGSLPLAGSYASGECPLAGRGADAGSLVYRCVQAQADLSEEEKSTLEAKGIGAVLAALLRRGEDSLLWGLAVSTSTPRDWTTNDLLLVKEAAERIWSAMERAQSEVALRAREADLARVQRIGGIGGIDIDVAGGLRARRSPEYLKHGLPGDTREESHSDWLARLHPDDRQEAERALFAALESSASSYELEYRIIRPDDGLTRWISARADIERDAAGRAVRLVGAHIDITEQKRAQESVQESEARFQQFARASGSGLWIRDADTLAMEYTSPAIATIYGVPDGALLGDIARWARLVVPEDREAALRHVQEARQGTSAIHEFRIQRPSDLAFRWIRNTDFPLHGDGCIRRVGGIAEDITDAKLAIEHQAVLLSELQHRVRNIMAIIRSIVSRSADGASSIEEYAKVLAGRLDTFARVQALLTRAANAGVGLATILHDELAALAHHEGQIDIQGPDVVLSPKAAETMTLAIHELATNALKYGALSTQQGRVGARWVIEERQAGPWLVFDWHESGAPAPPPASGPRRVGFGSELIEGRIPYELGGSGKVTIESGRARCHLEFPLAKGASVLETGAPRRATVFGGAVDMAGHVTLAGQRVLIVEDDYYLAADTARAVAGAGAQVLGPCPDEEAARAEIADTPASCAVLDIHLQGGRSFGLATDFMRQGVPFVFITGYDQDVIPRRFDGVTRLQKPVDFRRMVDALARALQA